jgi:hypothetical protein
MCIIRSAKSAGPRGLGLSHLDRPSPPDECDRSPLMLDRADRESSPKRPVLSVAEVYRLADAVEPRHRY